MLFLFSKKKREEREAKKKAEHSKKLREQAMANARAAKEALGEDTIRKITEAMTKKQQSAVEQARRDIQKADAGKVLDELKFMLDQKD